MAMGWGRRSVLALGAVLALVATACGGGKTSTAPSTPSSATAGLQGQSITVTGVWTDGEQDSFNKVLQAFNQKTGANAVFQSAGSTDLTTYIGAKIQGGSPPDVALLPNPGLLADFAKKGQVKSIEDVAGSLVDQNYAPIWRQLGSYNGTLYAVYFKAANKSTFWYNKHALSDAGLKPPTTFDDLLKAMGTISDSGRTPLAIDGGSGWPLTDWFENVYLRTAGPDMYDKLTHHQIPWTDASVKTALQDLAQVFKGSWIAGGAGGALQSTYPAAVANITSSPAKAALYYEGDFVASAITTNGAKLGTDVDFFDFPSVNNSPASVVGGGDAAVTFSDKPAARELIKYLASSEAAEVWAKLGGYTSANKGVSASTYPDDITRRSAKALVNAGANFRFDMSDLAPAAFGGTTGQGEYKGLQDFLRNPSDIAGVTQELETSAKQAYGS